MADTIWLPDLSGHEGPKYLALARALREAVRDGQLREGDRLPPVRDLAWKLGITPGTVARAYQIATQEGLLEAAVGRGTYVASTRPKFGADQPLMLDPRPDLPMVVELRSPQIPDVGQAQAIADILSTLGAAKCQDYLGYAGLRRDHRLRELYVEWLSDRILGQIGPEDIVLTHGGQNGLNVALQCCLKGARPHVICEELAYPGFRHAARLNRAELVPVALDGDGMRPDALDVACRRTGARIVMVTTEAQNPTAVRMSSDRRAALVEVARRHDLQIIEDDCYSVERSTDPSLRALAPERTWHVSSISKSVVAGLRLGAIVCPTGLGEAGRLAAQHAYFGLARPVADIVEALFETGEATELRDRVNRVYARRLEMAVNALGAYDLSWQKGLAFLWLRLPVGWRASTFTREAEARGVLVRSADEFALVDGHAPNAVRIALNGAVPEPDFARALDVMARLLPNPPGDLPV
ncbi:DNA-binding transcriptional MocR family regulator [Albidovulum inexpectatum]|uniref:DNA-binding transcriptional MocR family regulator n=1 Tax=Albidovulum inexpectatum TaxID=196587 RepID=A0A2S5JJT5_9RHOB|nr:PLP-dependent aminotransferase family protein [Albidovulum inexpectatum]PPB81638.1 DNA-binding transcriptional MocR family regulator [Albidovulum inexpectatum]